MSEARACRAASSLLASLWSVAAILACPIAHAIETPDARDKALPCRPTIACTADFVPPGTFELETGALFRSLGPAASRTRQWSLPFLAKLTMASWIQLQLGSSATLPTSGGFRALGRTASL